MRQSTITIVVNDPNRFFQEGLKLSLSAKLATAETHAEFTDCIFNTRAKMVFLAEDALSIANIHYLNHRLQTRPSSVFIIRDGDGTQQATSETMKSDITNYVPIYRDRSVESILAVVSEKLDQQQDIRNIFIPTCSIRSENNLTRRETEILRYLARGISNGGVARFLQISEKTVSAHKRNIMSKLNMIRPAELNYWLIQEGWCEARFSGELMSSIQ
ncbi:LuxR family transcriptional regulator [bacteria symbiont BFo1 of Frankliniella occidentalis]|nr:LuxR family transcriptional regulator [bacteria symbiont BFo1 of Frankliniella occidentalis]KYP83044.1 LuxR family transcriptional regulator [bacteria symbiont BFo1 of Frankliniella occidentalis]KYP87685.1 LuxR family transcriptional regulator [bacteria symbiont BFo1 of Frankliniella occidentalis]